MGLSLVSSIQPLVSEAEDAFRSGRVAVVERLCGQILDLDPGHVQSLHLLRLVANGKGDIEFELQILQRILSVDSDHIESLNGLGDTLRKQGQARAGIEPCLRAIGLRPSYANAHNTLGLCYFEIGSLTQAAECFDRALALAPNLTAACVNLGAVLKKLERNSEAVACYRKAVKLAPNSSEAQEALGTLLMRQRRQQEAIECFERLLEMNPNSAKAHLLLANSLQQQDASGKAYSLIQKALAITPNSGPGHCMLGFASLDLGDFPLAISAFERSISLLPVQGDAYLGMATSKKITEADGPLVNQMIELLGDARLTPTDQAQLHSALGKAYDDLGEYELAVGHVDEGNRIGLTLEGEGRPQGSREAIIAYIAKTIKTFTPDYYRKNVGVGLQTESPIFIVGLPRSGTTLLEQILSSHSLVAAGGEMRYWNDIAEKTPGRLIGLAANREATRAAAEQYVRRTTLIGPEARFVTDKYNDNFFNLGFLYLAFPKARVIHCRRNPADNCVSLYMTPFRKKNPLFRSREGIMEYYGHYSRLMAHWRKVLPSDRFLEVDYEQTVANHEDATRRLIAFCDLEWEDACLRHEENKRIVSTPSKWQARQPIYPTSLDRWKRYEPWLGPIRELVSKG